MSGHVDEFRDIINEEIAQARALKDKIDWLTGMEALDEVEKLTPMQMKRILQLYALEGVPW